MITGKLYGIGVGPGEAELLTLKALRIMRESDVIVVPGMEVEKSVAYQIVLPVFPEITEKERTAVEMPMTKDPVHLEESHQKAVEIIETFLKDGKQVAFLTLGDATVYSTYLYLHRKIEKLGYPVEIVSGIPSFCAAAARLNIGLVEKAEMLHVIPASYQIEDALKLPGTKVLMKAGRQIGRVKEQLKQMGAAAVMIENCGMPGEKVYHSLEEIPEDAGYYSLIIVKEDGNV